MIGISAAAVMIGPFSAPAQPPDSAAAATQTAPIEQLRAWLANPVETRPTLEAQPFASAPLTKAESTAAAVALWDDLAARLLVERRAEWEARSITLDGKSMRFEFRVFGAPAPGSRGRRLFISMHGGGNARAEVNDQQWRNQIRLYTPEEGIYLAPRAPTNTWNLWHEAHIDAMFDRLIEDAALFENVDTDRVFLMGYSAGGDGVYQLAPRTADRWAAAAMMAGHPNDASPMSLRNLPFAIHVGANDDGYHRNTVAGQWGEQLDALHAADPGGYTHLTELHAGRGHWMNRQDASAVPWMSDFTRNPWPNRVVWRQGRAPHSRLYWLATDADQRAPGATVIASAHENEITVESADGVRDVSVLLSDELVDLDRPVKITFRERVLFEGGVPRTIAVIERSLRDRADPRLAPAAVLRVTLEPAVP